MNAAKYKNHEGYEDRNEVPMTIGSVSDSIEARRVVSRFTAEPKPLAGRNELHSLNRRETAAWTLGRAPFKGPRSSLEQRR